MNRVIGQTGSIVLSEDTINRQKDRKRTVRYRYHKLPDGPRYMDENGKVRKQKTGWLCEVIGPFHSRLYGACSYGSKRTSAKDALIRRLANDYRYLGHLMFSDVDEADNVGKFDPRLITEGTTARPITNNVLVGSAGQ